MEAEKMEMKNFEALNAEEMEQIDGGEGLLIGIAVGFLVDGVIIATTGKSAGEWVATGIDYAAQKAVDTYRWMAAH